jgi:tetratricopeptide (TPR) repeat protein
MSRTQSIRSANMILRLSILLVGVFARGLFVVAISQDSLTDCTRQAQQLLSQERFLDARDAARCAVELDSHSAEARCLVGMAEFGLGNSTEAEKELQRALELNPNLVAAHRALGELYLSQKRLTDACHHFEFALASYPEDFESLRGLGLTLLLRHQPGLAETKFEKALRIKPYESSLLAGLLQSQIELKQQIQAGVTLTTLDSQLEKQAPRRMELASMLVEQGAYELAVQQFRRLLKDQPDSYELTYDLALAYSRAGDNDQAAALITTLLEHKQRGELQNLLGEVEQSRGNRSASVAAFRHAAELDPENEDYRYDYGESLVYASLLNEAAKVFRGATHDFPSSVRMWLGWGAADYLSGDYSDAAQTFLHAADLAPQDPRVYYLMGRAFDAAGPLQNTITQRLADYLANKPADAWAEYFFGRILALHAEQSSPRVLAQARSHLERAISLNPRLAEAHVELGGVLELERQLAEAKQELEKAVQLDPKSSTAFYKLAGLYRKTGEQDRARQALKQFQELRAKERADQDREALRAFLLRSAH